LAIIDSRAEVPITGSDSWVGRDGRLVVGKDIPVGLGSPRLTAKRVGAACPAGGIAFPALAAVLDWDRLAGRDA
jgi:hypothetical protein